MKAEFRDDNLRKEEVVGPIDPCVVADTSHGGQVIFLNSAPGPSEAAVAWSRTVEEIRQDERIGLQAVERMAKILQENQKQPRGGAMVFDVSCTMGGKSKEIVESHD